MLTQTIENLLNRNLAESPSGRAICTELKGRRLRVVASGPGWSVDVESLGSSLRLERDANATVHATVVGAPVSLLALGGRNAEDVLRRKDVRIEGDADVASRYRELLTLLRPDIEAELASLIGDSPAHQVLRFARAAVQFGERTATTTVRNTAEYFAHESRDLVSRAEAEDFFTSVDRLREDLDRLDARLTLLQQRAASSDSEARVEIARAEPNP